MDAFQIHERWQEELALIKNEMSNCLRFYSEIRIPALQKEIIRLEDKLKSRGKSEISH